MPLYSKQLNSSFSTSGSSTPRESPEGHEKSSIHSNKEKSQLCKKFMENGFCPYQNKCKFAHGSHELRRNHQVNSKYKTKECGVFITQGFCPYGERCNFIHKKVKVEHEYSLIDEELIAICSQTKPGSRLFSLLE